MTGALEDLGAELGLVHWDDLRFGGVTHEYLDSEGDDPMYRYAFARWWGRPDLSAAVVWVLLNPAAGDTELRHRPILDRCTRWSRSWGAEGMVFVSLFAFRHDDPVKLRSAEDPIGPLNDRVVAALAGQGQRTIAAWGTGGRLKERSSAIATMLKDPMCLGFTQDGEPRHPLYVPGDAELIPWAGGGGQSSNPDQ